jgi:hypothetical protein
MILCLGMMPFGEFKVSERVTNQAKDEVKIGAQIPTNNRISPLLVMLFQNSWQ